LTFLHRNQNQSRNGQVFHLTRYAVFINRFDSKLKFI